MEFAKLVAVGTRKSRSMLSEGRGLDSDPHSGHGLIRTDLRQPSTGSR